MHLWDLAFVVVVYAAIAVGFAFGAYIVIMRFDGSNSGPFRLWIELVGYLLGAASLVSILAPLIILNSGITASNRRLELLDAAENIRSRVVRVYQVHCDASTDFGGLRRDFDLEYARDCEELSSWQRRYITIRDVPIMVELHWPNMGPEITELIDSEGINIAVVSYNRIRQQYVMSTNTNNMEKEVELYEFIFSIRFWAGTVLSAAIGLGIGRRLFDVRFQRKTAK